MLSSVQLLSCVRLFVTPWTAAHQASLSITNSWNPPKPMPIESVMLSNHLILCHPLLLLPPIPPSNRVFSNESALHMRWPKYWSFSFYISPSSVHPGLISFRMNWLDFLAVQGTLKSLLQHHSLKHQFPVMFNSFWPHGQQHTRPPCPSPLPGACSNSCPLGQWWHPTISSSAIPFSTCLQSFPTSGSFLMNQLFTLGGQSIGDSALPSVLPVNIQGWFPLGLTGLISMQNKGLSRFFSSTTVQQHQFFSAQPSLQFN